LALPIASCTGKRLKKYHVGRLALKISGAGHLNSAKIQRGLPTMAIMVKSPAAVWVDASGRMVEKLAGLQATTIIFSKAALHHYLRGFAVKKNLPCRLPYRPPGWTIAGVATSGMVEAATIGVVETNGTTTSGDGQEEVPPAATTTSGDGQEEVPATATIGVVVPAATTSGDGQEEVPAASGMVMTGVAGNHL